MVMHENGRIDAEDLAVMAARALLLFRAGVRIPPYVVLAVANQREACSLAENLRRERRDAMKEIGGGL